MCRGGLEAEWGAQDTGLIWKIIPDRMPSVGGYYVILTCYVRSSLEAMYGATLGFYNYHLKNQHFSKTTKKKYGYKGLGTLNTPKSPGTGHLIYYRVMTGHIMYPWVTMDWTNYIIPGSPWTGQTI